MLTRLLPRQASNTPRLSRLAIGLFGLLVLVKLAMATNTMLNGYDILTRADGLPLQSYPSDAVATILSLSALRSLTQLIVGLICIVVWIRYRNMIPLMFTLLLLEHLGRKAVFYYLPIPRSGTPPGGLINNVILAVLVAGLAFSFWTRPERPAGA